MTAQIPDKVHYEGQAYAIIGVKGEGLLTPGNFGIRVGMWHTACWRGFVATYTCMDQELFLTELHIGHVAAKEGWKPINGVSPEPAYLTGYAVKDGERQSVTREYGRIYKNLKIETYFSGGILIADGFIQALYVHMGFGKPYQYEQVHELLFHEGTLVQAIDHSGKAAEWREHVIRQREEFGRRVEELKNAGLSDAEIREQLSPMPSEEELADSIEWRFSLDYDNWF